MFLGGKANVEYKKGKNAPNGGDYSPARIVLAFQPRSLGSDFRLQRAVSAGDGDSTGSGQFDNAKRLQNVDKRFNFLFLTGNFNDQAGGRNIDYFAAEDIDQFDDFRPLAVLGFDFNQHQIAFQVVGLAQIFYADDSNHFLKLLADLIENRLIANDDERHARQSRILGFSDGQRIDIVPARSEHPGNMGKNSGHVLNKS